MGCKSSAASKVVAQPTTTETTPVNDPAKTSPTETTPVKTTTATETPTVIDVTPNPTRPPTAKSIPTTPLPTKKDDDPPKSAEPSTTATPTPSLSLEKTKTFTSTTNNKWYKWDPVDVKRQSTEKMVWYKNSTVAKTSDPSPDTLPTSIQINPELKNLSKPSNELDVVATYQLRSTAVYSPPHGDRFLPGRNHVTDFETTSFKYYAPTEDPPKQATLDHSKSVMYRMNTRLNQMPVLPSATANGPAPTTATNPSTTKDPSVLPTFVSRGLQTDLEPPTSNATGTQIRYYEKQPTQTLSLSDLSNLNTSNQGFYHFGQSAPNANQPVLPPIELTPGWKENISATEPFQPQSILKKPTTTTDPTPPAALSSDTHEQVAEELRKQDLPEGEYRVKKVHLLEKKMPPKSNQVVTFYLPSKSSKANQSISKSERLFFSQVFQRKK